MPTSAAGSNARRDSGFTLVELMVVVAILAVLSTVVIVNMPDPRGDLRAEAERLAARTAAVRDAAIVEGRSTALVVGPTGYGFSRRQGGQWVPITSKPLGQQPWGEGVAALAPDPARIAFDSTGLAEPASVTLVRDAARVSMIVGADGSIDVR
jgi:general secretion pathway protein H